MGSGISIQSGLGQEAPTPSSEADADSIYVKKMKSKNIKRGVWKDIPGLGQVLRPKEAKSGKPKDLYLVRPLEKRTTGLPDGQTIMAGEGSKSVLVVATKKKTAKKTKSSHSSFDPQTLKLMKDMNVAVQSYARQQIDSDDLPTQSAIDEGRDILESAKQRVAAISGTIQSQVKDASLRDLSGLLYARVGKPKPQRVDESVWILSQGNILEWEQDLNAFESALAAVDVSEPDVDPFGGMRIEMEWLGSRSELGEFIHTWMPRASRNRHGGVGDMRISNVWRVKRLDSTTPFQREVERIAKERNGFRGKTERPERQPRTRTDLSPADKKLYTAANVGMMFHGTRSVNCAGILREGLRLPKHLVGVQITGAMFGPGLYWADDWKKSAGYCSLASSYWAGGGGKVRGRQAFMFVADVVCGTPYVAPGPRGLTGPPRGCHSVFGKAGTSRVMNNEWIVYKTPQHDLKYLVEFAA